MPVNSTSWIILGVAVVLGVLWWMRRSANAKAKRR
jgi:hypothetical protein